MPFEPTATRAAELRAQLSSLGLPQSASYKDKMAFTKLCGLTYPAIDNFVRGITQNPKLATLAKIELGIERLVKQQSEVTVEPITPGNQEFYLELRARLEAVLQDEGDLKAFADEADIDLSDLQSFMAGRHIANSQLERMVVQVIEKTLPDFEGKTAPEIEPVPAPAPESRQSLGGRLQQLLRDDESLEEKFAAASGLLLSQVRRASDGNWVENGTRQKIEQTLDRIDSGELNLEQVADCGSDEVGPSVDVVESLSPVVPTQEIAEDAAADEAEEFLSPEEQTEVNSWEEPEYEHWEDDAEFRHFQPSSTEQSSVEDALDEERETFIILADEEFGELEGLPDFIRDVMHGLALLSKGKIRSIRMTASLKDNELRFSIEKKR